MCQQAYVFDGSLNIYESEANLRYGMLSFICLQKYLQEMADAVEKSADVLAISSRLIQQNMKAYQVLAE